MNRLLTLLLIVSAALCANAQSRGFGENIPERISYQAVARAANGTILANTHLGVRIAIMEGFTLATEYVETHNVTTNSFGLFTLPIGGGTRISTNTFNDVQWSLGSQQVIVGLDLTGGTNYTTIDTTPFRSVPFAVSARNAINNVKKDGDYMSGTLTIDHPAGSGDVGIGKYTRDNSVLAYGFVTAAGGFNMSDVHNILTVVKNSVGNYTVTLNAGIGSSNILVPVVNVETDVAPTTAATVRFVSHNLIYGSNSFDVYITNGSYAPTDNDFTFVVMGK